VPLAALLALGCSFDARGLLGADPPEPLTAPRDAGAGQDAGPRMPVADAMPAAQPVPADAGLPTQVCGNGLLEGSEPCDDANTGDGDGCSADCSQIECNLATTGSTATHVRGRGCYWRSTDLLGRAQAESACAARGGVLMHWQGDVARRNAVHQLVGSGTNRVWVALRHLAGQWRWDSGARALGTPGDPQGELNFRSGEPSGDGSCAEWGGDGDVGAGEGNVLNDVPCDSLRDYVCERVLGTLP
jgi:cysteine-rich repeat protein